MPILGAPLGEVVERGEIRIVFRPATGTFHVSYFDHWLPVEPRSYPLILRAGEVAGGMHGSNRLGGNSLSDLLVFGRRAGRNAAAFAAGVVIVPVEEAAAPVAAVHELDDLLGRHLVVRPLNDFF